MPENEGTTYHPTKTEGAGAKADPPARKPVTRAAPVKTQPKAAAAPEAEVYDDAAARKLRLDNEAGLNVPKEKSDDE